MRIMKIAFVVANLFDNTRDFIRTVAQSKEYVAHLLEGDEDVVEALRVIRFFDRVWFEGVGSLFHELLRRETSQWVTGAVLRVGEEDIANVPFPECWKLVSDLIVPSQKAADIACQSDIPASGRRRIHIIETDKRAQLLGKALPFNDLDQLGKVLTTPPNDLHPRNWQWVSRIGDICGDRVLVLGDPPEEFLDFVKLSHGREVLTDTEGPAAQGLDTIIFWELLRPETASQVLAQTLKLLKPRGTVAVVCPEAPKPGDLSGRAALRLLSDPALWDSPMELESQDPAVLASPANSDEKMPQGEAPCVEVTCEWPLVSVVVPVYNDEERVGQAIVSLRRQTYPNLEIVVIDDGSTDGTRQAVERHLNDPRVRYFYKPHSGRPGTRNIGIEKSRGEYIAWLDSDDESLPNRIAAQMQAVRGNPAIDIIHADGFYYDPEGELQERRRYKSFNCKELPGLLLEGFCTICPILNTSATIRRSLYERIGLYDLSFYRCQDYDFYVRTAIAGDVVYHHVPAPLVKVHTRPRRWDACKQALKIYYRLVRKLLQSFTPEQLIDAKARDLQESPALALVRKLLGLALLYKAPLDHPLFTDAHTYLEAALQSTNLADRAGARSLLGVIAYEHGFEAEARNHYQEALRIAPELLEAKEGLKFLQSEEGRVERLTGELELVQSRIENSRGGKIEVAP